jgi:membrane fusion protein (multidrug efflux system)
LQFTDITVDQGTGSVTLRAIFPNPRFVLLPGMFVRARIEEGVKEDAFLVPQVGVTHDPNGQATALVVGPDSKVAVRPLQLRGTTGTQWIVESGLNDGDRVVVAGVQKVQPGAVVQAVESQAATTAATPSAPTTAPATAAATPSASIPTKATAAAMPSAPKTVAAAGEAAQPPPGTPAAQAK